MGIVLKIIVLSSSSLLVLFILTKIMGNREVSQLSMFDYIVGITIGSIAAEMATSLENNFIEPLVAMTMYALLTTLISYLTCKSLKIRRFITGKTSILFDNNKFYRNNLIKAKLDLNEFLTQCRLNGFFDLSDIQTAILEPNGKISFLPVSNRRPANPEDLNLSVNPQKIITTIIIDSTILMENLKSTGNNINWLNNELKKQGISSIENIFLATCDYQNNLSVYLDCDKNPSKDLFQ